ncbi:MAG TPA: hypothetical protein VLB44_09315, partial [Kofleriaceae bacterium]|nr:hypothetical protein [Kofleriaceae bacterium]
LFAASDPETAFALTAGAVEAGLHDQAWMVRCPAIEPLRSDPRWAPLAAIVAQRAKTIVDAILALALPQIS